jgi:hypothetical protein
MDLAMLNTYIATIGKDKILGFNFDNSRRVARRLLTNNLGVQYIEAFDDRFTINVALEAIIIREPDIYGVDVLNYIPIEGIQGVYAVDDPAHIAEVDVRYSLG